MPDNASGNVGAASSAPPRRQISNISMPRKKAGMLGTISNFLNSIVGAGLIGIPYAISNTGLIAGILLLVLVAWLTDKSTRMIVELSSFHPKLRHLGVHTYEDLARIPFGRTGAVFVMLGMFVLAYGAQVSYFLIIKDTVPVVLGIADANEGSFTERELTMVFTTLLIVLPLSLLRDMAYLAYTSFISVLADVFLVGFVIAYSPIPSSVNEAGGFGSVVKDNIINERLFIGFGVMSFAMTVQHSTQLVANSMENKTPERWARVTFYSVLIAAIMCLCLGITGYLGFLGDTQGNILNNFESDSIAANAGRALLAITMFFTYPMESYVSRHVLVQLLYKGNMDGHTIGPNAEVVALPKCCGILGRREQVTLGLYIAALVPALIVNDLGPVLSITGSLGASVVAYIACGMIYLGVNGDDFLNYCREMLRNHGYKVDKTPKPTEVELPVVGDATATMTTTESNGKNYSGNKNESIGNTSSAISDLDLPVGLKPWWWYLLGFPLWVSIARKGATGTRAFLEQLGEGSDEATHDVDLDADDSHVVGPCKRDYYISMFLIAFGAFATVVGVVSNIYVEIKDVFFTPT